MFCHCLLFTACRRAFAFSLRVYSFVACTDGHAQVVFTQVLVPCVQVPGALLTWVKAQLLATAEQGAQTPLYCATAADVQVRAIPCTVPC